MAKNTTLGRKTGTGLNKNEGYYAPSARQDQSGDGADFAFNGQMGDGVNRAGDRGLCANPLAHLVKNPDSINHGTPAAARSSSG